MPQNTAEADRPLTLAQLDFWEEFRLHPDEPVSTVAHAIEFTGTVDAEALARAISRTVAETDVLALRFTQTADGPRQRLDPGFRPELRRIDLGAAPAPRDRAMAMMLADLTQPLDLVDRPLAAQWLLDLGPGHLIWYNRGHHIVLDGFAMGMIESRAARLYAAELAGDGAGAGLGRFADYLDEEAAYRAAPRHAADGRHWSQVLAGMPATRVLTKGAENYPTEEMSHEESLADLQADLLARSAEWGIGWPDLLTLLCAAWAALDLRDGSAALARGADGTLSTPVWLPYLSRMGSVAMGVPALVVNILPFGATLHPDEPSLAAIRRLAAGLRGLRRHGRYRIEQIAADHGLGPSERFFFSPLINVLPFDPARFQGCETRREVLSNGPGDGFNITIRGTGSAEGLALRIDADPALTPGANFARHRTSLPRFLRAALAPGAEARPLGRLLAALEPL